MTSDDERTTTVQDQATTGSLPRPDDYGRLRLPEGSGPVYISLPGYVAVRIDPASRVIAVDGRDSARDEREPAAPEWTIRDLRDGIYGGFHRLHPADECFDAAGCASQGQHDLPAMAVPSAGVNPGTGAGDRELMSGSRFGDGDDDDYDSWHDGDGNPV